MARRTIGSAVALTAAVVVSGCGSSGDPAAFAQATDRTCRDVTAAASGLRQELVRGTGETESAALRTSIERYAASVEAAAEHLAAAEPPSDDGAFQDQAVRRLKDHASGLRDAVAAARRGRLTGSLSTRLSRAAAAPMPTIPAAVLDDAPACRVAAR